MSQKLFPEFSEFIQFPRIVWCKICWNSLSQSVDFFIFSSVAEKDFGFNLWKTTYVVLPLAELSHVCWSHIMISAVELFSFPSEFWFSQELYALAFATHVIQSHVTHYSACSLSLIIHVCISLFTHVCYTVYYISGRRGMERKWWEVSVVNFVRIGEFFYQTCW